MVEEVHTTDTVTVIIPAFNEEKTIQGVVRPLLGHPLVAEVVVVDDGSTDGTARVAGDYTRVVSLRRNGGKALAMDVGVRLSRSRIILFLDADLVGLTPHMVSSIVGPVLRHECDMFLGSCGGRRPLAKKFLRYTPKITGQRALRKELWNDVPAINRHNFEIEMALNYFARKNKRRVGWTVIDGLGQITKEQKRGLWWGAYRRIFMYRDLASAIFKLYVIDVSREAMRRVIRESRFVLKRGISARRWYS